MIHIKRLTLSGLLIYLFFVKLGLLFAYDGSECAKIYQKNSYPLPSKYDTNWFLDDPPVPKNLPKLGEPFIKACWEVQCYQIFKEVAGLKNVPFDYPYDGCYARALYISKYLEDKGYLTGKVFVEGDLKVVSRYSPHRLLSWQYHVAPTMQMITSKGVYTVVIDPSLFDHPVPIDEWVKIQTKHNPKQKDLKLYKRSRFTYYRDSDENSNLESWDTDDLKNATEEIKRFSYLRKKEIELEKNKQNVLKKLKDQYKKKYGVEYEPGK